MNNEKYEKLFSKEDKAKAFDKIAEHYYDKNFGGMSKNDLELLMFSIYIEQILNQTEDNLKTYSDYTISKDLGIIESRVKTLKEKKQQKYPYKDFDWRKSFARLAKNATYDNGKIKIELRDKNLYNEIKNVIENQGGFVEVQLNSTLLQVPSNYYIDFLCCIEEEENEKKIREKLQKTLKKNNIEYIETRSTAELLKEYIIDTSKDVGKEISKEFLMNKLKVFEFSKYIIEFINFTIKLLP